ncbi:hypothetical protein BJX62DRAFT_245740 [Aspergillus germanicus]
MRYTTALATLATPSLTLAMPGDLRALQSFIRETEYMEKTCLRGCYAHKPPCLEHMGDCWTCCEDPPDKGTSSLEDVLSQPIDVNRTWYTPIAVSGDWKIAISSEGAVAALGATVPGVAIVSVHP